MDENQKAKIFLKAWARYTLALASATQPVLKELANDPAPFQQVQFLEQTHLSTDAQRREVAMWMALQELNALIAADAVAPV